MRSYDDQTCRRLHLSEEGTTMNGLKMSEITVEIPTITITSTKTITNNDEQFLGDDRESRHLLKIEAGWRHQVSSRDQML